MKKMIVGFLLFGSVPLFATAYLEIDLAHEIDLKDGTYLAKEYFGQGRYALISHSRGRFEGGDIGSAACTNGFVVSKLPAKFIKIKKVLKPNDFVLTNCNEDMGR